MRVRELIAELYALPMEAHIFADSNSEEFGEIGIELLLDEKDESIIGYVLFDEKRKDSLDPNEPVQLKLPFEDSNKGEMK